MGAGRPRQQAEAHAALELDESVRLIYDSSSGELFYRGPHLFGGLDHWSKVAVLEGARAWARQIFGCCRGAGLSRLG
ncbi:MAG: hypothetical protein HC824_05960 [Synechococcales cyanobacterium RM1_1_8]|nr:hypothetical protein [Synechococcales cyanobacterium RM1_1_8]